MPLHLLEVGDAFLEVLTFKLVQREFVSQVGKCGLICLVVGCQTYVVIKFDFEDVLHPLLDPVAHFFNLRLISEELNLDVTFCVFT